MPSGNREKIFLKDFSKEKEIIENDFESIFKIFLFVMDSKSGIIDLPRLGWSNLLEYGMHNPFTQRNSLA